MTYVRRERFLWLSWLSKLMAGETTCVWSPWYRVRVGGYPKAPSDFNRAGWIAEHNLQLIRLADELREQGHYVRRESQNRFRVEVAPGLILAGKPDLIAVAPDGRTTVYDVKTGLKRTSDIDQVMLAMLYLPMTDPYRGRKIHGKVVYADGEEAPLPASCISQYFRERGEEHLQLLLTEEPPARAPSPEECRFCDLTREDCEEREEWGEAQERVRWEEQVTEEWDDLGSPF